MIAADISELEAKMGISRRWEPSDPRYVETVKYIQKRSFQRAADELHRLVVFRLLELHKLNLAKTGM